MSSLREALIQISKLSPEDATEARFIAAHALANETTEQVRDRPSDVLSGILRDWKTCDRTTSGNMRNYLSFRITALRRDGR